MFFDRVSDSISLDAVPEASSMLQSQDIAITISQVVKRLEKLGARIHPSSRLLQYMGLFEREDDVDSVELDHALLESLQFLAVVSALEQLEDPSAWLSMANTA